MRKGKVKTVRLEGPNQVGVNDKILTPTEVEHRQPVKQIYSCFCSLSKDSKNQNVLPLIFVCGDLIYSLKRGG